jgi:hypothetical protein
MLTPTPTTLQAAQLLCGVLRSHCTRVLWSCFVGGKACGRHLLALPPCRRPLLAACAVVFMLSRVCMRQLSLYSAPHLGCLARLSSDVCAGLLRVHQRWCVVGVGCVRLGLLPAASAPAQLRVVEQPNSRGQAMLFFLHLVLIDPVDIAPQLSCCVRPVPWSRAARPWRACAPVRAQLVVCGRL